MFSLCRNIAIIGIRTRLIPLFQKLMENLSKGLVAFNSMRTNQRNKNALFTDKEKYFANEPESNKVCRQKNIPYSEHVAKSKDQTLLNVSNPIDSNYTSTCQRSNLRDVSGCIINNNSTSNILKKPNRNSQLDQFTSTKFSKCFENKTPSMSATEPDYIEKQLYNKFKNYLDASRKVKPSICIVQTIKNSDPRQSLNAENSGLLDEKTDTSCSNKRELMQQSEVVCIENHNKSEKLKQSNAKITNIKQNELKKLKHREKRLTKAHKKERLQKLLKCATSWQKIKNQLSFRRKKIMIVRSRNAEKAKRKINKSTQSEEFDKMSLARNYSIFNIKNSKSLKDEQQECFRCKYKSKRLRTTRHASISTSSLSLATSSGDKTPLISNAAHSSSMQKIHAPPIAAGKKQFEFSVLDQNPLNESENVIVSSTTNSYDEATLLHLDNLACQVSAELRDVQNDATHVSSIKDQSALPLSINYLTAPSKELPNPVKIVNGHIDYVYYEIDILIIVQEKMVSFWKYFKIMNVLGESQNFKKYCPRKSDKPSYKYMDEAAPEWLLLGECRRLVSDIEIPSSYTNRICIHNYTPIYMEMRCRELPRGRRDCNLLSMYINLYYFDNENKVAKMHSIQLDSVQSLPSDVIYSTITETRYFVMCWPQENILGKPRTGLCKYSLTPNLDTLASIRDFKHIGHFIRYLECTTDNKLLGFGDTQLTVWDHRSGDVLMNFDFNIKLGQHFASIYYPNLETGQNSMFILFQYIKTLEVSEAAEVLFIACIISHASPSYRIIKRFKLPSLAFNAIENAINIGDNIILTAENNEEIWINCTDPTIITRVSPQYSRRFYTRGKSQIIELTCKTLTVNSFANHIMKIAANPNINYDRAKHEPYL